MPLSIAVIYFKVVLIKERANSNDFFLAIGFPPKLTPLSTQNKKPTFCINGDDIGSDK